jgi:hypothetical protein
MRTIIHRMSYDKCLRIFLCLYILFVLLLGTVQQPYIMGECGTYTLEPAFQTAH